MTARAPFTQATIRKAIKAARKEGLYVHGIRPDGTLVLGENPPLENALVLSSAQNVPPSKWEDVEA